MQNFMLSNFTMYLPSLQQTAVIKLFQNAKTPFTNLFLTSLIKGVSSGFLWGTSLEMSEQHYNLCQTLNTFFNSKLKSFWLISPILYMVDLGKLNKANYLKSL